MAAAGGSGKAAAAKRRQSMKETAQHQWRSACVAASGGDLWTAASWHSAKNERRGVAGGAGKRRGNMGIRHQSGEMAGVAGEKWAAKTAKWRKYDNGDVAAAGGNRRRRRQAWKDGGRACVNDSSGVSGGGGARISSNATRSLRAARACAHAFLALHMRAARAERTPHLEWREPAAAAAGRRRREDIDDGVALTACWRRHKRVVARWANARRGFSNAAAWRQSLATTAGGWRAALTARRVIMAWRHGAGGGDGV
jgi:hypothetical protein